MPKIQQLSPHVADLIAAGEVVERPASAAKELVENAIDAGARNVTVELQNGGMTFLRVTDDGCGIPADEAETAFLRHATSKLRQAADLEAIHTLGFRGEALAAISSVSRIDLLTKTADAPFGLSLHLEAGKVTQREEAGCPDGTTIIVRDLFFNTPARMKFMKRDTVEGSALLDTVRRLAVAHPEVSFRVLREGEELLHTSGDGQLLGAVYAVLGRQTAKDMIAVDSHWEKIALTGFVTKPTATRGNRSGQLFFVNGRFVRSKTLMAALEEAYRNRMMVGRFPACVLHLHIPEHLVDVNVHPAKTEVKFLNEREVFDCVRYGVQGALDGDAGRVELKLNSGHPAAPKQDFYRTMTAEEYREFSKAAQNAPRVQPSAAALNSLKSPSRFEATKPAPEFTNHFVGDDAHIVPPAGISHPPVPSVTDTPVELTNHSVGDGARIVPPAGIPHSPAPAVTDTPAELANRSVGDDAHIVPPAGIPHSPAPSVTDAPAELANHFVGDDAHIVPPADAPHPPASDQTEPLDQTALPLPEQTWRLVGEAFDTYLIVEQGAELLLIDKHAAHERILFEKLRARTEPVLPQLLLQPIVCTPEREETAVLLENSALLAEFGYDYTDLGGALAIRQIPAELDPAEAASSLTALAGELLSGRQLAPEALRDNLLHTVACKAAIKGSRHTDEAEKRALVAEVLSRSDIQYCPHGRPVCIRLTRGQLERQFKRG